MVPLVQFIKQVQAHGYALEEIRESLYDRDSVFADAATAIAAMNSHAIRTAPRSPWQNAYVERVIGSIRRECVIVVNAAGLHRVLMDYVMTTGAREQISHLARTRRARVRLHRRQPVALSPVQKSAVCTIATNAAA